MRISLMSSENLSPEWFNREETVKKVAGVKNSYYARISRVASGDLSEDDLTVERDIIENCAEDNSLYYSNAAWGNNTKSALREYCMVCGASYKEVSVPDDFVEDSTTKTASDSNKMSKEADSESSKESEDLKLALGDPFKIDQVSNERKTTPSRDDWEFVSKSKNLSDKPSMMTNNIIPIGGGEDYNSNPNHTLPSNQNSIVNPDAIEQFANSDELDTGVRLKQQAEDRKKQIQQSNKEWEDSKTKNLKEALGNTNMYSRGSVFLTESMDAQTGLNNPSSQMGVYSDFSKDDIPDKTEGEKLHDVANSRRESIQRESKESHKFELEEPHKSSVGSDFAESLKRELNKIENS